MTDRPFGSSPSSADDRPFGSRRAGGVPTERATEPAQSAPESSPASAGPKARPETTLPGDLDGPRARRYEETFLNSFRASLQNVTRVPCPLDGIEYDRHPDRESVREWDDSEEVRRISIRRKGGATPEKLPAMAGMQVTIYRKPLFGQRQPKVCLVAACWSPIEQLAGGSIRPGASPAGVPAVEWLLERCMVDQRPDVFHYIGLCSTTGWEDFLLDPLPSGPNWVMGMIWPKAPGWLLSMPPMMPGYLAEAFDPEGVMEKRARVIGMLRNAPELQSPGGLMLLQDICDLAVVPPGIALDAMHEFTLMRTEFEVREVGGATIIQYMPARSGLNRGNW